MTTITTPDTAQYEAGKNRRGKIIVRDRVAGTIVGIFATIDEAYAVRDEMNAAAAVAGYSYADAKDAYSMELDFGARKPATTQCFTCGLNARTCDCR